MAKLRGLESDLARLVDEGSVAISAWPKLAVLFLYWDWWGAHLAPPRAPTLKSSKPATKTYIIWPIKYFSIIRLISLIAISGGLIWSFLNALNLINSTKDVTLATSFLHLPVMIYSTGIILFVLTTPHVFDRLPRFLADNLNYLGKRSYLIFLSHTLALRLLFGIITGEPAWTVWLTAAGLLAGGCLVSKRL